MPRSILIICLVFTLWCSPISASVPMKFQQWFHGWYYGYLSQDWSTGQCKPFLDAYWTRNSSAEWKWSCEGSLDCILNETSPSALQELSGSLVVLGLTPTLLSTLGPSLGESAMLSFQRPGLSLLLSLGAPAIWQPRILTYDDPLLVLKKSPRTSSFMGKLWPRAQRHQRILSVVEYILALSAIGNVVYVSLQLGWNSVLSWKCEWSFFPLAWALIPAGIHILSALAFWLTPKDVMAASNKSGSRSQEGESSIALVSKGGAEQQKISRVSRIQEFDTSYSRPNRTIHSQLPTFWSMVLFSITAGFAVGHVMFGTMIFSSLLFLRITDALSVIFRYALSTIVCRFISQYELSGMSERLNYEYPIEDPLKTGGGSSI